MRTIISALLAVVIATGFIAISAEATEVVWDGNGHVYEAVYAPGLTWASAQAACAARGGHLVTISSGQEDSFVKSLFENNPSFWYVDGYNNALGPWTGGVQSACNPEPGCGWGWVTGEPMEYTGWAANQPDNCCGVNQNRIEYFRWNNSPPTGWDDAQHYVTSLKGYIFEDCRTTYPFAQADDGQVVVSLSPPSSCFGPQDGEFLPSKEPCEALVTRDSRTTIRYGCASQDGTYLMPNLDVTVRIETIPLSGSHGHDNGRPLPVPALQSRSTGNDGRQLSITHEWPEDARDLNIFVYSTDSECPCGSQTVPAFRYCVKEGDYELLTSDGSWEDTRNPNSHPQSQYGTAEMVSTLSAAAYVWRAEHPTWPLLGYNDVSLPSGGILDYEDTWDPPHCGHRQGITADIRSRWDGQTSYQYQVLRAHLQRKFSFSEHLHYGHFHATLRGASPLRRPRDVQLASLTAEPGTRTDLSVVVACSVRFDVGLDAYIYTYDVSNSGEGADSVDVFSLRGMSEVDSVGSPEHWMGSRDFEDDPGTVTWFCVDMGFAPIGATSPYAIAPGGNTAGFVIVSPWPPGTVEFFAKEWGPVPDAETSEGDDPVDFWADGVSGTTVGPVATTGINDETPGRSTGSMIEVDSNPASQPVHFRIRLGTPDAVTLDVFDMRGRRVRNLLSAAPEPGIHEATWDLRDDRGIRVSSGVYLVRLVGAKTAEGTQKLLVIK